MSDTVKAVFEVINPRTGHRYVVYPDGRIEGFGEATIVINRIPAFVGKATEPGITKTVLDS